MTNPIVFCWSQFLDVAKFLKEKGDDNILPCEAAYRCSISRAYYAAFGYSMNYAKDNLGYYPEHTGDDHRNIRDFYRSKGKNDISRRLDRLHQRRKNCDYDEPVYSLDLTIQDSFNEANYIIESLSH